MENLMQEDPYASFAERYDLFLQDPALPGNEVKREFFTTLFEREGVERVLDCACGTGEDLRVLHSVGARVTGTDISEAMLAKAREKLAGTGMEITLERVDFRELPGRFEEPFDAVVCLATSLPHMLEEEEVLAALRSMHGVLRDPGGVLVLSQGMSDRMMVERPRIIPALNVRDHSRIFFIDYHEETVTMHVLDLFHGEGENDFRVDSFEYRMIGREDYERLLKEAGFRIVEFYSSFGFEPYDELESNFMVVVARR